MQNTVENKKASELIYQGPLIGMRSTRSKPADANTKTTPTKQ